MFHHSLFLVSSVTLVLFRRVFVSDWLWSCVLKLSLFLWPEQPIKCQASWKNKWLGFRLWDLKGLKGKIVAQNMGTKIGLIKLIYFVIFCAGCMPQGRSKLPNMFRESLPDKICNRGIWKRVNMWDLVTFRKVIASTWIANETKFWQAPLAP